MFVSWNSKKGTWAPEYLQNNHMNVKTLGVWHKHETTHSSSEQHEICQARLVWQDKFKYFKPFPWHSLLSLTYSKKNTWRHIDDVDNSFTVTCCLWRCLCNKGLNKKKTRTSYLKLNGLSCTLKYKEYKAIFFFLQVRQSLYEMNRDEGTFAYLKSDQG